jgi:hypothetical protein
MAEERSLPGWGQHAAKAPGSRRNGLGTAGRARRAIIAGQFDLFS